MKRWFVVVALVALSCMTAAAQDKILIAMVLEQADHLKAYGIAYWVLTRGMEIDWLLNYRGGSFMMERATSWQPNAGSEASPSSESAEAKQRGSTATSGRMTTIWMLSRWIKTILRLTEAGSRVSLFIDPDLATIDRARALDVPAVELHTGVYAHSWPRSSDALAQLGRAARHARSLGLAVHAGHGLTFDNVAPVAAFPRSRS